MQNVMTAPAVAIHREAMMSASGTVAARLLANNFDVSSLRTNALLRYDEWKQLDTVSLQAYEMNLQGINDLYSYGLTHSLGNMGVLVSMWNRMSQMNDAEVSMWAHMDAEQARIAQDLVSVPVPCIFKEFQLDIRLIAAYRNGGGDLQSDSASAAGQVVAEKLEQILFNGNTTVYGTMPIYGYRTHPNRNVGSGGDWGTVANVYANVEAMLDSMYLDGAPGPYVMYVNKTQWRQANHTNLSVNALESPRVTLLKNNPDLVDIKYSDQMADGEAVMVSMNRGTVDIAIAEEVINVEWDSLGGLSTHFRTMFCGVPRVKADYEGRSGIVHYTGI